MALNTITITLPEDRLQKLKATAAEYHISPEDLARIGVEELLARPDKAFQDAMDLVLKKNAELYRRLA